MDQFVARINALLIELQKHGENYVRNIGKSTKILGNIVSDIIIKAIPSLLYTSFDKQNFVIEGSVGFGLISKCPWVAIRHKEAAKGTRQGVYIVFLFSRDLKDVYLTFNQGVEKSKKDILINKRNEIRNVLQLESDILLHDNDFNVDNKDYKLASIYTSKWDPSNNQLCAKILQSYINVYDSYISRFIPGVPLSISTVIPSKKGKFSIKKMIEYIDETGLQYDPNLIKRFAFSLMTKPFVILSGLAGSGKTQLALVFAKALVEDKSQICTVAVGADWTNREPLLGYPNALDSAKYVSPESGVLDLLIEASKPENQHKPYFLILDEMNMSYVERYFADFLSGMESREPIKLWNNSVEGDIPKEITLPKNLYIVGTINVDETTYMFSPKVLDRASVIEFKISVKDMTTFLSKISAVDSDRIYKKASSMAEDFVEKTGKASVSLSKDTSDTLVAFFTELKSVNAEFGYRAANEIYKYIEIVAANDEEKKMTPNEVLDSAIVQKLLPKLHGSRKKLTPALKALWRLCCLDSNLDDAKAVPENAKYPLSADKILRMYLCAVDNGFTSFSEA